MYAVPAAPGPTIAATCGTTPLMTTCSRKRCPVPAKSESMSGWLDPGSMRAPPESMSHTIGQRPLERHRAQARDLLLARVADAAALDGEVVRRATHTMRPSTLPNAVTTRVGGRLVVARRAPPRGPSACRAAPISKKTPSSKSAARRSRAVILPRACCFAILSGPPISRTLRAARLEVRHQLTHVRHRRLISRSTGARASRGTP